MKKNLFKGSLFTVGASLWWGVIGVLYFKFVSFASALELAIHRTIWTALLLVITTTYFSKWKEFKKIINKRVNIFILLITGLLISINWLTWLYAVKTNNLLDGALGYYIFPILSVFFGIIFLKEKYNKNQVLSVLLVVGALIYLLIKQKTDKDNKTNTNSSKINTTNLESIPKIMASIPRPTDTRGGSIYDLQLLHGVGPKSAIQLYEKGITLEGLMKEWTDLISQNPKKSIILPK